MKKKIRFWLYVAMGSAAGVFLGTVLARYLDYRSHPGLYAMGSAPWYAGLWETGAVILAVLFLGLLLLVFLKRKENKENKE